MLIKLRNDLNLVYHCYTTRIPILILLLYTPSDDDDDDDDDDKLLGKIVLNNSKVAHMM